MKKTTPGYAVSVACALLIVGLAVGAAPFPVAVTDEAGSFVTVSAEPRRIVSLSPSHTEILCALGLKDRLAGVTEYCNFPPDIADKPRIGGFSNIDLEQVVGVSPDLVLASTIHLAEVVPRLKELDITVFVINPPTVQVVLDDILTIGLITGQARAAAALVTEMQERIDAALQAIEGAGQPEVFWELGAELYTAGPGSFIDDLITLAGGANVAADAESQWPQLSVEAIVMKDPQVIVLADHNYGETSEKVATRPGWQEITAVKQGRIVELTNDDIFSRPGPRIVEALEFLARTFHPDRF